MQYGWMVTMHDGNQYTAQSDVLKAAKYAMLSPDKYKSLTFIPPRTGLPTIELEVKPDRKLVWFEYWDRNPDENSWDRTRCIDKKQDIMKTEYIGFEDNGTQFVAAVDLKSGCIRLGGTIK